MIKTITFFLFVSLLTIICIVSFGCSSKLSNNIVIYSSCDQVRNAAFMEMLTARFPNFNIDIIYLPTGVHGSRLLAEGINTSADIVLGLEVSHLRQVRNILANLNDYDVSYFASDLLDLHNQYLPWERFGCVIAINEVMLQNLGLPVPVSYEDLLNPIYQGLIMMPNPRSSSTGHLFLAYLINKLGEDEAYIYFDDLAKNVNTFPSSGSGVTTALLNEDIAIGFTMIHNALNEIDRGANLSLTFFEEYSPSSMSGIALTQTGSKKSAVVEVFNYLINEVSRMDKDLFSPGQVFIDFKSNREHYPADVKYKLFILEQETMERMLTRWRF